MPFTCDKHGYILYGDTCLNCDREREPITPKITPPTPRFSPRHIDSIQDGGAFALAMTITPIKPDAQMEGFLKWRKAYTSAIIGFDLAKGPSVTVKSIAGLRVET